MKSRSESSSRGGRGGGRSFGPRRSAGRPGGRSESAGADKIEPLHPTLEPPDIQSFREFDLPEEIQLAIEAMGITIPTPIQRLAIQPVLEGRDVIAKAETGTGKTLAFAVPIVAKLESTRSTVLALVLCPTRELAQQVCSVLAELGKARGLTTALVVGGEPMHDQINALKKGAQIVVGTPGRVLDLYGQGFLSFPWTEFVVLDEADEMLEIGFLDDVKKILSFTPPERQTLHFSATFPHDVLALSRQSTRNPVELATAKGVSTVDTIRQVYMKVNDEDRPMVLRRVIESSGPDDVFLVFCDRRTEVDRLMRVLERAPFSTKALHGGFDQSSRFRVMSAFRTGEVKALVATDVASRGLDVALVTHVINFSVPQDILDYTHRIGRTGRAGRTGTSITFVTRRTERDWLDLISKAPWKVPEESLPEERPMGGRGSRYDSRPRREERPAREERPRSETRPPREDRLGSETRPPREDRPGSESRPPREDRPGRESRPPREERSRGDVRPPREERTSSESRPPREERPRGDARPPREERPQRTDRSPREELPRRVDRPAPEERPRPADRPAREVPAFGEDRPAREALPRRVDRPVQDEPPRREERPAREQLPRRVDRPAREERPAEPSRAREARPAGSGGRDRRGETTRERLARERAEAAGVQPPQRPARREESPRRPDGETRGPADRSLRPRDLERPAAGSERGRSTHERRPREERPEREQRPERAPRREEPADRGSGASRPPRRPSGPGGFGDGL